MDNNNQKWYQGKNFKIIIFILISFIAIGAGFVVKMTLPKDNLITQERIPPFQQALTKGKEASILTQTAQSPEEWDQVSKIWKDAIAILKTIPETDENYTNAQNKIREYEGYLDYAVNNYTNPPYFRNAVNNAMEAAVLSQNATTAQEWETIAAKWNLAIEQMKKVPVTDPSYSIAKKKVIEYQLNLDYTLENNPNINIAGIPNNTDVVTSPEFQKGISEATKAANLTQTATMKKQWVEVSGHWENAIINMKRVPNTVPQYATAQEKILQYQNNLDYSKEMIASIANRLTLVQTIRGTISPKSVVYSGNGLFFAQNMMYQHTITVYDNNFKLVKTLSDSVKLSDYGHTEYQGEYQGAPVEAAFSHGGKYAWISNYQMYGSGFNRPGDDVCSPAGNHDHSYLYKINTDSLEVENVIKVGAVPKYVAVSGDNKFTLVSNWCSYDLSIIDTEKNEEIKRVSLGRYPRGIVVDKDSQIAYVAVMGSFDIAKVHLEDFNVTWLKGIGSSPRHLVIDPQNKYLYATLNGEGRIAKIEIATGKVITKVATGAAPRSMDISDNGKFLYVVNYHSNTVSKVRTRDMQVLQTVQSNANPIGITYNPKTKQVWVACYSGSIMVFEDGE